SPGHRRAAGGGAAAMSGKPPVFTPPVELGLDFEDHDTVALGHDEIARAVQSSPYVTRSRVYGFVLDQQGNPIELGSGRFAKAFLGEERWVESKTAYRRHVAIKVLQRGVSAEDQM